MKKNNPDKNIIKTTKAGKANKKDLPVKNPITNAVKNAATQTAALNQSKTTRDDLFPSDGDNLTN